MGTMIANMKLYIYSSNDAFVDVSKVVGAIPFQEYCGGKINFGNLLAVKQAWLL